MRRRGSLLLGLLLLGTGCERQPRTLPGLAFAADGRLVAADLAGAKARREAELARVLAAVLDPAWQVRVRIVEDPLPTAGEAATWWAMTVAVELLPTGTSPPPPDLAAVEAAVRAHAGLWCRGEAPPAVECIVRRTP